MVNTPSTGLVPARTLQVMEATVARVSLAQTPALFQQTLRLTDLSRQGLGFEQSILEGALTNPQEGALERALSLYRRPSRLFYRIAPQAEKLQRALGIDVGTLPEPSVLREDLIAQSAWARFGGGAMTILDMGVLYDPVGDMSGGINYFLDRQGLHLHWKRSQEEGLGWMPPPAFGFVSRENDERIARYNQGLFDRLGDVDFGFPDEIQMVVLPQVYRPLLREKLPLQIVIPAASQLDEHFTVAWAANLPDETVIVSAVKGFTKKGHTPLEHLQLVLEKAGKEDAVAVIDFLGLLPSKKTIRDLRDLRAGKIQEMEPKRIVIATRRKRDGVEFAKRQLGPEAVHRTELHGSVWCDVVENTSLQPPVQYLIVSDPDMMRASELASILKNERAIDLGRILLERMVEGVDNGRRWDSVLHREFISFYYKSMEEARDDIQKILELEKVPPAKSVLLEDIQNDLDGSWMITEFGKLYELVRRIFDPKSSREDWEEAMALLKLRISDFYAVRNPCYGFGLAATREAARRGKTLNRQRLQETLQRLLDKKLITPEESTVLLAPQVEAHMSFTMIPSGLWPEGMQTADVMPKRYPGMNEDQIKALGMKRPPEHLRVKLEELPQRMQDAHLFEKRKQEDNLFDPKTYLKIVNLSGEMGMLFPGHEGLEREAYATLLRRLADLMESGRSVIKTRPIIYPINRDGQLLIMRVVGHLHAIARNILANEDLTQENMVLVNQAMVEILTVANLFYMLTPEESRKEAQHLVDRLKRLRTFTEKSKNGGADKTGKSLGELFALAEPAAVADTDFSKGVLSMRVALRENSGVRLIELTRDLNRRFYRKERAVNKEHVIATMREIRGLVETASQVPEISAPFLESLLQNLDILMTALEGAELQAGPKTEQKIDPELLIYQAMIETLVHARRFLVFPDEAAPIELGYTIERFNKIMRFIKGKSQSPLWNFGNAISTPPPPAADAFS